MIGISFRFPQENPLARLGAENVFTLAVDERPRSIFLWCARTERQLAQIAKSWQDRPVHSQLICSAGTYGSPTLADLLPNRIHVVPMLGVFLAQPLPLCRTRYYKIEP